MRCVSKWSLQELRWHSGGSTAHIAFCESVSGPAVLKVSVYPNLIELEEKALRHFGPSICPRVLEVSVEDHAILLERIDVEHDLATVYPSDEAEIAVWIPFIQAVILNEDIPDGFPTLAEYALVFERVMERAHQLGASRVMQYAHDRREILMGSPDALRVLHGDMHHFNFLRDRRGKWRLIDPHGVVGNPLYEIGAFMRNPMPRFYKEPDLPRRLRERLYMLSERLRAPCSYIAEYGFYGVAFSIAWDLEDGNSSIDPKIIEMAEDLITLSERSLW